MQSFQQQQLAFIRRIKDPTAPLPAGMRPERMAVYEELFFNNLQNFVCSAFPVLLSIIPGATMAGVVPAVFPRTTFAQSIFSSYLTGISAVVTAGCSAVTPVLLWNWPNMNGWNCHWQRMLQQSLQAGSLMRTVC